MKRQHKELTVEQFKDRFVKEQAIFAVDFGGVSVVQLEELRNKLREEKGELKVAKVRLVKLAADSVPLMKVLVPYCSGQIAFVFSSNDPVSIAKVLKTFSSYNENFNVGVAYFDSRLYSPDKVLLIADLPTKPELLAKLCCVLNTPLSNFVRIHNLLLSKLVRILNEIKDKK